MAHSSEKKLSSEKIFFHSHGGKTFEVGLSQVQVGAILAVKGEGKKDKQRTNELWMS